MKILTKKITLLFLLISSFTSSYATLNIMDYGADNTGKTNVKTMIDKAIDELAKEGGGTLYFPAGIYLTGPIHMKSNITLNLDAGAVLKFSDNFDDYLPMIPSRWEGTNVNNFSPLIYAWEAENISIVGRGQIDGQGKAWWDFHHTLYAKPKDYQSKWQQLFHEANPDVLKPDIPGMIDRGFCRPPFIQFLHCNNIRIEGITITNSPFWTVNPQYCQNVTIDGVTIINPDSPNTDGINPESCKNVHIANCYVSVGDDCITLKSGKDRDGRKTAVPCENITITNCTLLEGHGAVVIGSEMSGDVKKVTISNCVFEGTDRGIRIKSARGRGGVVEDITVSNIVVKNLKKEAIKLNMQYHTTEYEPVSERTPSFRNIHISNMTGTAQQAVFLLGLEELPIHDISFSNIQLKCELGITMSEANRIELHNVNIDTKTGPALKAENTSMLEIDGLSSNTPKTDRPLIELNNVQQAFIHSCFQTTATPLFLSSKGAASRDIFLQNNVYLHIEKIHQKSDEVSEEAVTIK
ncbi:glycoside hydrolase family 28 protein [Roseimarinus sediminis]|uniref:glycoside hydrolase family 28 protein n=1 Tax=Roseimarinus sediminis TaxID=1610899 RepID=UPI003D1A443A